MYDCGQRDGSFLNVLVIVLGCEHIYVCIYCNFEHFWTNVLVFVGEDKLVMHFGLICSRF